MSETHTSEEMTSFEVLHTQNGMPESLDEADYSFMPDNPFLSGECLGNDQRQRQFDMTNLQSALSCTTPDLSVEEINKRLVELLEENETMKEALKRNNSMMEEQLTTISAWHQQMTMSKAQQQASLIKEKESRSTLEKENIMLLEKIKNLEIKLHNSADKQACSECEVSKDVSRKLQEEKDKLLSEKNDLVKELNLEKQFHRQLEQNVLQVSNFLEHLQKNSKLLEAEKKELTTLNNMLQLKLSILDTDFDTITHTDEETGYEVIQQRKIKDELMEQTLLHLTEAQDKVHLLTEKVIQQDTEIASLRKHSELSSKDLNKCQSLEQQVKAYQEQLENLKKTHHAMIQELREKLRTAEEMLGVVTQKNKADELKLHEIGKRYNELQSDYERVTKLFEILSKDEKEKMEQFEEFKQQEIKRYLEQIDTLTAQLVDKEQNLEEKIQNISDLTSELKTVKEDAEVIPILKAQVEVYKVDLQHAIAARESAHEEVERLTNEFKCFQAASSNCPSCGKSSGNTEVKYRIKGKGRSESRNVNPGAESPADTIKCPICDFGFTNLRAAENHVNRCIDQPSN